MNEALAIAEKFVPKEEMKKLAQTILRAQTIYEESWVTDSNKFSGGYYSLNDVTAASKAAEEIGLDSFWVGIIESWNCSYWNDIQWWAEAYLKENVV